MAKNVFEGVAGVGAALGSVLGATGYHLWRVATLRADFARPKMCCSI